jgi:hypothetical protein
MRFRESAESGNGTQLRPARRTRPAGGSGSRPSGPRAATAADRLDYIADMARQLEAMSADIGCRCLAALLELAQEEALRQRRVARRPPSRRV